MTALGKGNKWSGRQRRPWEDSLAMPRRPRRTCWTDAACYHVMNRGQNRATIFADDNDRQYFLGLLGKSFSQGHPFHQKWRANHFAWSRKPILVRRATRPEIPAEPKPL